MILKGVALAVVVMLAGCDQIGIETPAKAQERALAEAKAIGSACRHAMRAIEDCYTLNPKADKSAVHGGWREMDEYMRENKLDGIAPVVPRPPPEPPSKPKKAAPKPSAAEEGEEVVDDGEAAASEAEEPVAKGKGKKAKGDH
ncbi:MAG: hypothetical protein RLZZ182_883 [Pseudomonadota bacterium]|jgi:hypothetical protein